MTEYSRNPVPGSTPRDIGLLKTLRRKSVATIPIIVTGEAQTITVVAPLLGKYLSATTAGIDGSQSYDPTTNSYVLLNDNSGATNRLTGGVQAVAPTGTIELILDGTSLGVIEIDNPNGFADAGVSVTVPELSRGSHTLVAKYSGDSQNDPSTSTALIDSMGPFFLDNFSGSPGSSSPFLDDLFAGTGTPNTGIWTNPPSTFQESGVIGDLSQSGGFLVLSPAPVIGTRRGGEMWTISVAPVTDYMVEAIVSWAGSNSVGNAYVGGRFTSSGSLTGYFITLTNHTSGATTTGIDYILCVRNAGSDTFISASGGTVFSTSGIKFGLSMVGSTITMFVNNASTYTMTDVTASAAGHILVASDGSANVNGAGSFKFDEVKASPAGSAAGYLLGRTPDIGNKWGDQSAWPTDIYTNWDNPPGYFETNWIPALGTLFATFDGAFMAMTDSSEGGFPLLLPAIMPKPPWYYFLSFSLFNVPNSGSPNFVIDPAFFFWVLNMNMSAHNPDGTYHTAIDFNLWIFGDWSAIGAADPAYEVDWSAPWQQSPPPFENRVTFPRLSYLGEEPGLLVRCFQNHRMSVTLMDQEIASITGSNGYTTDDQWNNFRWVMGTPDMEIAGQSGVGYSGAANSPVWYDRIEMGSI